MPNQPVYASSAAHAHCNIRIEITRMMCFSPEKPHCVVALSRQQVVICISWKLLIVCVTDIRGITSSAGQVVVKDFMQLIYLELRCIIEWAKKVPG